VFFSEVGQFLIDILPESMKGNPDYFANNIIDEMTRLYYPRGRRPRGRRVMFHFDNAPINWAGTVRDRMAAAELERMEHPPYSPGLAPCDFFLFGSVKEKLVGKQNETPEDLVSDVRNAIERIPPDVLKIIFECWKGRSLDCWKSGGEYVRYTLHFGITMSV
jgi:hypothetical protein